jgi:hypothetical protein
MKQLRGVGRRSIWTQIIEKRNGNSDSRCSRRESLRRPLPVSAERQDGRTTICRHSVRLATVTSSMVAGMSLLRCYASWSRLRIRMPR